MRVEKCREILKVHIQAAESVGKFESALSLLEVLDAIDRENQPPVPKYSCRLH